MALLVSLVCLALSDTRGLCDCLSGPHASIPAACESLDCDGDADVDLRDFAEQQRRAVATSYYVAGTSGVDTVADRDGTDSARPWRTLQFALDHVDRAGLQIIKLKGGEHETHLTLDSRHNGLDVLVTEYDGDAALVSTVGGTPVVYAPAAPACAAINLTFENLDLTYNSSVNGWIVRHSVSSTGDFLLSFHHCALVSTRHGLYLQGAGAGKVTRLTGCRLEYTGSAVLATSGATCGDLVFDNCTFNETYASTSDVMSLGGAVTSLTIANSLVVGGTRTLITAGSRCQQLTLLDSTFVHRSTTSSGMDSYGPTRGTRIEGCQFLDEAGPAGQAGLLAADNFMTFSNGGGFVFRDNEVDVFSAATETPYYALRLTTPTAASIQITDNHITSRGSGIYVSAPTVDGPPGDISSNAVHIEYDGIDAPHANGIMVGLQTDDLPPTLKLFGPFTIRHNWVQFHGHNAGICLLAGRSLQAPGTEVAYNTLLSIPQNVTGINYALYAQFLNTHCHHNCLYSRSGLTLVGIEHCTVEYNSVHTYLQTSKGCASITQHTNYKPLDCIIHHNIICAENLQENGNVFFVDGGSDPRYLDVDENYYAHPAGTPVATVVTSTALMSLSELQNQWNALNPAHPGLAGNDLNSQEGFDLVFEDPQAGDFRLNAAHAGLSGGATNGQ